MGIELLHCICVLFVSQNNTCIQVSTWEQILTHQTTETLNEGTLAMMHDTLILGPRKHFK